MERYYLLWASGADRPGIVAGVTSSLFRLGCNIQDSSMMRLGSEFGILMIFTSRNLASVDKFENAFLLLRKKLKLNLGIKKISKAQARFQPLPSTTATVSVHGADRPGIVSMVTEMLSRLGFNITDLSTHRTSHGKTPGFILFIEGEPTKGKPIASVEKSLKNLEKKLGTKITVNTISSRAL